CRRPHPAWPASAAPVTRAALDITTNASDCGTVSYCSDRTPPTALEAARRR
ncbi:MAG: hypothetical protein AVDCRST_MAG49-417, partial [uncultured Thermomicrobiales bacterium]